MVWLGLRSLKETSLLKMKLTTFQTSSFKKLQLTINNLNNIGVETINQLDVDSFLYATGWYYVFQLTVLNRAEFKLLFSIIYFISTSPPKRTTSQWDLNINKYISAFAKFVIYCGVVYNY